MPFAAGVPSGANRGRRTRSSVSVWNRRCGLADGPESNELSCNAGKKRRKRCVPFSCPLFVPMLVVFGGQQAIGGRKQAMIFFADVFAEQPNVALPVPYEPLSCFRFLSSSVSRQRTLVVLTPNGSLWGTTHCFLCGYADANRFRAAAVLRALRGTCRRPTRAAGSHRSIDASRPGQCQRCRARTPSAGSGWLPNRNEKREHLSRIPVAES